MAGSRAAWMHLRRAGARAKQFQACSSFFRPRHTHQLASAHVSCRPPRVPPRRQASVYHRDQCPSSQNLEATRTTSSKQAAWSDKAAARGACVAKYKAARKGLARSSGGCNHSIPAGVARSVGFLLENAAGSMSSGAARTWRPAHACERRRTRGTERSGGGLVVTHPRPQPTVR